MSTFADIEHLDFQLGPPGCSFNHCTRNADYRIESRCPHCHYYAAGIVCHHCFLGMTRCMSYLCYGCDAAVPFNQTLVSRTQLSFLMEQS